MTGQGTPERHPDPDLHTAVQEAHVAVQRAQRLAYERPARLRTRLALNRAQTALIKLLVHGTR